MDESDSSSENGLDTQAAVEMCFLDDHEPVNNQHCMVSIIDGSLYYNLPEAGRVRGGWAS